MNLRFERECRTPYSECYTILEEDQPQGRFDVHFAGNTVHATLTVSERFTQEEIQDLIDDIDAELLDAVGLSRDDLIVHVHQGREIGVFSHRDYDESEEQEGGSSN
ncbi:MAG: hypothetical protein FJ318_03215 [SAR202 cluster bacterium]|nr:hypothetical protein [SAR202 cluster bacterium]